MESEKRLEPRKILEDYYSVEFEISPELPIHQFRIRDVSPSGMGILVNGKSAVLERLKVGDILEMKYNPAKPLDSAEHLRTEIRHITTIDAGPFRGHYLVGIKVLETS